MNELENLLAEGRRRLGSWSLGLGRSEEVADRHRRSSWAELCRLIASRLPVRVELLHLPAQPPDAFGPHQRYWDFRFAPFGEAFLICHYVRDLPGWQPSGYAPYSVPTRYHPAFLRVEPAPEVVTLHHDLGVALAICQAAGERWRRANEGLGPYSLDAVAETLEMAG